MEIDDRIIIAFLLPVLLIGLGIVIYIFIQLVKMGMDFAGYIHEVFFNKYSFEISKDEQE